jgi:hypothetical protein
MATTHITGYALAKNVNRVLTSKGLKVIPPQMVYNYMRNKLIPTVVVDGQDVITVAAAQAWMTKFVTKRQAAVAAA